MMLRHRDASGATANFKRPKMFESHGSDPPTLSLSLTLSTKLALSSTTIIRATLALYTVPSCHIDHYPFPLAIELENLT